MKKVLGILGSALFVIVVIAVAMRVNAVRKVTGIDAPKAA